MGTGIDAEQMVSVNNVEREQQAMMIQNMINENSEYSTSSGYAMPSTSSTKTLKEEESSSNATLMGGIVLFFAVIAVGLGAMNLMLINKVNNSTQKNNRSTGAPVGDDEVVTLGSKEAV